MRDFLYDLTSLAATAAFIYGVAALLLGAH